MDSKKNEIKNIADFVEKSSAFDERDRVKLFVFLSGKKPATFVHMKIGKNLHDKHEFERLLKKGGFLFQSGKAKGFEEIVKIKNNSVIWNLRGIWFGHDLFHSKKQQSEFKKYKHLLKNQKHSQADIVAGKLYNYPSCCIKSFIQKHKKSHSEFYSLLHSADNKFPFIMHVPCSINCKKTKSLNNAYKNAVKQISSSFYSEYCRKRKYKTQVIVEGESSETKKEKMHEYVLAVRKRIEGKYWLISHLSNVKYSRGTILSCTILIKNNTAAISNPKKTGFLKDLHHERHFALPVKNKI